MLAIGFISVQMQFKETGATEEEAEMPSPGLICGRQAGHGGTHL